MIDTPIGRLMIVSDGNAVVSVDVTDAPEQGPSAPLLMACADQLTAYFAGTRRAFDVPVSPAGTDFQRQVWAALQKIPWGETRTYGEIAAAIGCPKASRAVGGAIHRNPLLILIPCHRVVGQRGLTGFRAGLDVKSWLLTHEHM